MCLRRHQNLLLSAALASFPGGGRCGDWTPHEAVAVAPDHMADYSPLAYVFPPTLCFGKYAHGTLLGVNVICLLVIYTNKMLRAAICLCARQNSPG